MGAQGSRNVESGNEWSTPAAVVEHAARVLGIPAFDLDPAATAGNAKAPAFFTRKMNGLMRDWFGHVWLNPPFSRSLSLCIEGCSRVGCVKRGSHVLEDQHGAVDFARKAVGELTARRVDAIAWHGPVAPDTDWHAQLEPFSQVRYEFGERIKYNGESSGGTFPSATTILRPERRAGPLPVHHVPLANLEERPCDCCNGMVLRGAGGKPVPCPDCGKGAVREAALEAQGVGLIPAGAHDQEECPDLQAMNPGPGPWMKPWPCPSCNVVDGGA